MKPLTMELLPLRPAVRSDAPITLDVLLRILPPAPDTPVQRPALNLGLVLDHSGSMAGSRKIDFARQAAAYAVQQLLPEDRVSITIFDDAVDTIAPSGLADNKPRLVELINQVQPAGSTALFAGWEAGGKQVRQHHVPNGLNRVLLLTDGLANVGETNPDNIATAVKRLAVEGVSTSAMGVGDDYNEDLLEAMARSGDGNYYYIESPRQLPDIFQTELRGLMATVGSQVLLGVEPVNGVTVAEVLNDLERDPHGRYILPNLIVGMPVEVVLRLNVPAQAGNAELLRFHLDWLSPRDGAQHQDAVLTLPAVPEADWNRLAPEVLVQERAGLQLAGRFKREATRHMHRGERDAATTWLQQARQALDGLPRSEIVQQEERDLQDVEQRLQEDDFVGSAKLAKFQHYRRSHSK
jgi:Ca-activated chloride channel family protein